MRYNKIRKMDISNGEGIRVSIFVQGCSFNCQGCFNPETHDFNGGKEFTKETLSTLLKLCDKPMIKGLSILGGEPLHSTNVNEVFHIVKTFKEKFPNKDIWLWTGFQCEDAIKDLKRKMIIDELDYLVDGRFVENKKNLKLKWAGSDNQRCIDIKKTKEKGEIVLYE